MKKFKLTKEEQKIENDLISGKYRPVTGKKFEDIAAAIAARRKDVVMTIRLNGQDVANIKKKAKKLGVKYQTFISEVLHEVAAK